jgi:hypothetical protein
VRSPQLEPPWYPPTDENREKMQEYLVNYFRVSAFDTCKCQQLPMMNYTPLKVMLDPDATLVACHTPIPVPLHWQEHVKEGLDQDICLGVLEPVPVGEPVTWCQCIVVCAKKNGEPCRTIDLQAFNCSQDALARHPDREGWRWIRWTHSFIRQSQAED